MTAATLSLFELSAAFDTDHTILLDRFYKYYINNLLLGWFNTYLPDRTHSAKIGASTPHTLELKICVHRVLFGAKNLFLCTTTYLVLSSSLIVALSTTFMLVTPNCMQYFTPVSGLWFLSKFVVAVHLRVIVNRNSFDNEINHLTRRITQQKQQSYKE